MDGSQRPAGLAGHWCRMYAISLAPARTRTLSKLTRPTSPGTGTRATNRKSGHRMINHRSPIPDQLRKLSLVIQSVCPRFAICCKPVTPAIVQASHGSQSNINRLLRSHGNVVATGQITVDHSTPAVIDLEKPLP